MIGRLLFLRAIMLTNVYIDGFNLYYGCLRRTRYKWLDLTKLCQILLPKHKIQSIKYFTAHVSARPNDLDQPIRQQTYLRALRTLPTIQIIMGHFLTTEIYMPLADKQPTQFVKVIKTEEKGSDVNLASHLIHDAYQKKFAVAVVITNDSDLLEPIRIVRRDLGYTVGLINPHHHPSRALLPHVTFYKQIRESVLARCQFPTTMHDNVGFFTKPATW